MLLFLLALDFGIQLVGSAAAILLQTERFYDLFGGSTFVILALFSYFSGPFSADGFASWRQSVVTSCVALWGTRLSLFLFNRINLHKTDSRFDKVRGNPGKFFLFWMVQGVWVFVTSLPVLVVNTKDDSSSVDLFFFVGVALFSFGLILEAVADSQKFAFRSDERNKHSFISSGVWAYSRHPNYLGEIIVWIGVYLLSVGALQGGEHVVILSPLFIAFLLLKVSGIPILERKAQKQWGESTAYKAYVEKTPLLVPFIYS